MTFENLPSIIQEFIHIAKIDCASLNERLVADYMIQELSNLGFNIFEDDTAERIGGNTGNLIATLPGELDGCVMLSAHLDRVDRGVGINPRISGDYIESDGSTILAADNVSGLVVILDGLRRLKQSGKPHPTIEVVLSVSEEKGILGARMLNPELLKSDLCFVFDSTGPLGRLDTKRPYKAMIEIEVFGKDAHGGSPEKGVNAITAACDMLAGIKEGRLDEESTSNIGVFHGGKVEPNTVCNHVIVKCEARSIQHDKLMAYIDYFGNQCEEKIRQTHASMSFKYNIQHNGYSYSDHDAIVQIACQSLKNAGIEPELCQTMEGCDGNIFVQHGIPAVSLGMGNSDAHTLIERVRISELIRAGEVAEKIILEYARRHSK